MNLAASPRNLFLRGKKQQQQYDMVQALYRKGVVVRRNNKPKPFERQECDVVYNLSKKGINNMAVAMNYD